MFRYLNQLFNYIISAPHDEGLSDSNDTDELHITPANSDYELPVMGEFDSNFMILFHIFCFLANTTKFCTIL